MDIDLDLDLDNENNLYYQLFLVVEYYVKKSYDYIVNFYELDQKDINKSNTNEETKDGINNESNILNNENVDIDENNFNELCISIGNLLLEDSYEIVYEDNIDKEL
jgi:hypothetical protein